jgi:hypothetical protein
LAGNLRWTLRPRHPAATSSSSIALGPAGAGAG